MNLPAPFVVRLRTDRETEHGSDKFLLDSSYSEQCESSNSMAPHSSSHHHEKKEKDREQTLVSGPTSGSGIAVMEEMGEEQKNDRATSSTSVSTKRYLQEENRDLRQHLVAQQELIYQAECRKSEALLRILRLQDRRWRKENQKLRDQVAHLQYQLQQQKEEQIDAGRMGENGTTTTTMRMVIPNGSIQTGDNDERVELEPCLKAKSSKQQSEKKGYEVFKACTESPPGLVETEDNQEDELMAVALRGGPNSFLNFQKKQQQPQPPDVWMPFHDGSQLAGSSSEAFTAASPSEAPESIIDFDEFFDCASLISSYSARDAERLWDNPDLKGKSNDETESNNDSSRIRQGKYGKKKRRWKSGCWKKLAT